MLSAQANANRARRLIAPLVVCAVALGFLASSHELAGADRIWSALVLASNATEPAPPAPELAKFSGKVQRVFGYNQVKLIGSATKTVDEDCERWLVPSQNFWMSIKAKRDENGAYQMGLELFHDKRRIVQAGAKLAPDNTIIIRGPMHAKGQLLIVLQLQD